MMTDITSLSYKLRGIMEIDLVFVFELGMCIYVRVIYQTCECLFYKNITLNPIQGGFCHLYSLPDNSKSIIYRAMELQRKF